MLVDISPMDGSIGPPFLNGELPRVAAQPKSIVNGNYHTVVREPPRDECRVAAGAADERQAAPAARRRLVLAFNDLLRLALELKDVQPGVLGAGVTSPA